jgi:hypothetical protein
MNNEFQLAGYAPILSTANLPAVVERDRRKGFGVYAYADDAELADGTYALACFGSGAIHMSRISCLVPPYNTAEASLWPKDADELYNAWAEGDVEEILYEPKDTECGLREFSGADPDRNVLRLGSPLETQDKAK